jgi:riboflavin kinase / FMN adenylyltransferase
MELIRDWSALAASFPGSALTIGNFDGVHVGHQQIIARAVEAARRGPTQAVVFTFEPHPAAVLHPDRAPERILDFDRKLQLFDAAGVDVVICPDGPLAVLAMPPEDFVRRIIVEGIGAATVVEGPDFSFGRWQQGDNDLLQRMAGELGFRLQTIEPVVFDDRIVSSTRIRRSVREGRMADAQQMLGRPFEFIGRVVHGRHRGRGMGYPTVNLSGTDFLLPGDGVYAGAAVLASNGGAAEGPFAAAISVGREPTFGELPQSVVEAYLLDYTGDAYGRTVKLDFFERLRDQVAFEAAESLAEQMSCDCETVRTIFRRGSSPG